jgi:hypothetical protein
MVLLQDSVGMTPAAVLERATRMPAEFLGLADSVGTIREGAIADLLLVDADPLVNVANLRRLHTILLRGVVFDRADLDRLLATVRADPDRTVNDWPRTGWAPPAHRTRSEPRLRGHQDRGSSTAAATVAAVARLRPGESP